MNRWEVQSPELSPGQGRGEDKFPGEVPFEVPEIFKKQIVQAKHLWPFFEQGKT